MKSLFHLSAWLPAILALGASAQTHASDPADPSAHVSAPVYHSAFDGYRSAVESTQPSAQHETTDSHQDAHAGHGSMQHQQMAEMPDATMESAMHMHSAHQHREEEPK